MKASRIASNFWPWFFFATAFQSLLAVVVLLLVPSEGGLSVARASLLAILFLFFFTGLYFGFIACRDSLRFDQLASTWIILSSTLLFLALGLLLFLLRYLNPERFFPYYERLSPLLWYLFTISAEFVLFLLFIKNGVQKQNLLKFKPIYESALFSIGILLVILLFVVITKIGIKADTGYWGEPGVAIQGWQFVLSIVIGLFILFTVTPKVSKKISIVNVLLPLALYVAAVILWLGVPLEVLASSFYSPISPPANIPFPYSDAGFYDYLSQSLLIGTDYFGSIPPRPFYVVFLAILHILFGQNYPAIITAQTFILAFFPVTLYFLGKKLHTPAAGVTVALFAIFRELVGLWISSNTRVVNTKILTTDFPTAMVIALMCLVAIWWLERRDVKSTFVAGGAFGLLLLFRTQSLFILPALFVLTWFAYQRKRKEWIVAGVTFGVIMVATVFPWLIHNYTISGKLSFDDPQQVAIIYSQYSFAGNLDISQFDPEKDSIGQRIISFTSKNPEYVARFFTAHFLNTEIGGLLSLPLIKEFSGLYAPINLYWVEWNGVLEWYNLILIIVYLIILGMGLGAAWHRMRWLGLIPLAFNIGYAFANGVARFSSWRYNLPVDWVVYFYFAIGAIEIIGALAALFGVKNILPEPVTVGTAVWQASQKFQIKYVLILLAFVLMGSLPWLAKGFAQPRYTSSQNELIARLTANGYDHEELLSFLSQPNSLLMEGRLLYPRMYRRNEGLSSANPWIAYAERDFARIGFVLINDVSYSNLIFPTREVLDFPQGADTIVLVCKTGDYLDVRVVDFATTTYQSTSLSQPCP